MFSQLIGMGKASIGFQSEKLFWSSLFLDLPLLRWWEGIHSMMCMDLGIGGLPYVSPVIYTHTYHTYPYHEPKGKLKFLT